tara:strand:+ start:5997 stop:6425 length:429 start_codon:yes stop_codon:yes gene_type:complete
MKAPVNIIISLSLIGFSLAVFAVTTKDSPFDGVLVEGIIDIETIPSEVEIGSVKISNDDDVSMAKLATITSSEASRISSVAISGNVIETKLEDENGYLVWKVEMIDGNGHETELMIDAGNGRLLAAEEDEEDDDEEGDDEER